MTNFSTKLLALDLAFYQVHNEGYDPIDDIKNFWDKYDIKSCQDLIFFLFLIQNESPGNEKLIYTSDQLQEFLMAVLYLIRGYFEAHNRKVDLREIDLATMTQYNKNDKEQKLSKEIYEFFERVSSNLNDKL